MSNTSIIGRSPPPTPFFLALCLFFSVSLTLLILYGFRTPLVKLMPCFKRCCPEEDDYSEDGKKNDDYEPVAQSDSDSQGSRGSSKSPSPRERRGRSDSFVLGITPFSPDRSSPNPKGPSGLRQRTPVSNRENSPFFAETLGTVLEDDDPHLEEDI